MFYKYFIGAGGASRLRACLPNTRAWLPKTPALLEHGALTLGHCSLKLDHAALKLEHGGLTLEHGSLTLEHDCLKLEHGFLKLEHGSLTLEHLSLKLEHGSLCGNSLNRRAPPNSAFASREFTLLPICGKQLLTDAIPHHLRLLVAHSCVLGGAVALCLSRWPYVCHEKRACMHISTDSSLPHNLLQLTSQAMVFQDQLLCFALWYPQGRLAGPSTFEGPDRLYYIQKFEVTCCALCALRHTCFAVVHPSLA